MIKIAKNSDNKQARVEISKKTRRKMMIMKIQSKEPRK